MRPIPKPYHNLHLPQLSFDIKTNYYTLLFLMIPYAIPREFTKCTENCIGSPCAGPGNGLMQIIMRHPWTFSLFAVKVLYFLNAGNVGAHPCIQYCSPEEFDEQAITGTQALCIHLNRYYKCLVLPPHNPGNLHRIEL